MKSSELERLVQRAGWYLFRQKGSHRFYKHPTRDGTVVIPFYGPKEVPDGTAMNIMKKAGIKKKK